MSLEYRTEVVGLDPGAAGQTSQVLTALAAEGWRLAGSHLMPVRTSSLAHGQQVLGLLVLLERERPPGQAFRKEDIEAACNNSLEPLFP